MQRRALEHVIGNPHPFHLRQGLTYHLGGTQIFFWGISEGVGTCSDLHGTDIAVFGFDGPSEPLSEIINCSFAGLVRSPTDEERRCLRKPPYDDPPLKITEGLSMIEETAHAIRFMRSWKKGNYIPL